MEINGVDQALPGAEACIGFLMPNSKLAPERVLTETKNSLMLVGIGVSQSMSKESLVSCIEVEDPRTTYIQVLNEFFSPAREIGIHPTAVIDSNEIGVDAFIDRGTLQNTVIEDHAKIDNLVHVAHNCEIETGAFVIASTVLCSGVVVGKNSWIAPNSAVLEEVTIGENATVGLSSTVIRNVVASDVVVG